MRSFSWLLCATGLYALVLAAVTILNWSGADRWWLGALNLYLPQVMWAVPGIFLAIVIFKTNRSWVWLPLMCLIWVLGPIMGFCWSPHAPRPAPGASAIRVMTWNIKYGYYDTAPLLQEIMRWQPDVVLFQDASRSLSGPLGPFFTGWQVRSHGQFVIASKHPLSEMEVQELPSSDHMEEYLRCRLHLGTTVVTLCNVHFKTPRRSLNSLRMARKKPWYLPVAIQNINDNATTRLVQAVSIVGRVSQEQGPVIVAGDLNSPETSMVCATLGEAGLHDAFAEGGRGYGFTYGHFLFRHRLPWLKFSWMRIDHIMMNSRIRTQRCWTGTGKASDHRPVIADLVVRHP